MRIRVSGLKILLDGRPVFLLGANYWSRKHNIKMWKEWDPESVRRDLSSLKKVGLQAVRVFLLAEDFAEPDGSVRPDAIEKLRFLLDIAGELGLFVFPSLIVGHMSGKNWLIPWDPRNEIYSERAIERAEKFVREVVSSIGEHPALGGWILSNEISNVRVPASVDEYRRWVSRLVEAIKSVSPGAIVGVGDSTSPLSRFSRRPEHVVDLVDFLSPHIYHYDNDPVRHTYAYSFIMEYCLSLGKATVLEEYGFPTSLYGEESHARFASLVAFLSLALGVSGSWVWCAYDFTREEDEPYLWEPHELSFGILRSDGTTKPAAERLSELSEFAEWFEEQDFEKSPPNCAILVPRYFYEDFPFYDEDREDIAAGMLVSYILAKAAGLRPTFVREGQHLGYALVIVPPYARLLTTTWRSLLQAANRGATVYYSHVRYVKYTHVSACHIWEDLFGVRPTLRAGEVALLPKPPLKLKVLRDLPPLREGDEFEYPASRLDAGSTGFEAVDAHVYAEFNGKDALFCAERDEGRTVLSAFPLELYLASSEKIEWERGYHKLYEALSKLANVEVPVEARDPRVQCEEWRKGSERLVFLINHDWSVVETEIESSYSLVRAMYVQVVSERPLRVRVEGKSVGVLYMTE